MLRLWRESSRLNPARIPIITREYVHDPLRLSLRGGPRAADHVNILGNAEMILDVITVASGGHVDERIASDIQQIAQRAAKNLKAHL